MSYINVPPKYGLWSGAVSVHLVGRCILYSYHFLDPLIRQITTRNTWNLRQPAWPRPNDVKSFQTKPNAPSKWATFDNTNNKEYCVVMLEDVGEVLEMMRIEEEPPIDNAIHRIETFVECESATDFKDFEALHNTVLNIDIRMFKWKLDICMMIYDDHLRCFSETLTNWYWMSSAKKSCLRGKWLRVTCSNIKFELWFLLKKNCALNCDAYLNGCVLKREITILET